MAGPDFLPFPELVAQIAALCAKGASGTVLLVSDDNRMGQVHLHGGQIVFVLCRGRRGRDALGIMRTMRNARLSFDAAAPGNADGSGLPTGAILAYLDGSSDHLPEAGGGGGSGAGSVPAARAAVSEGEFLTPAVRSLLQAAMLRYIGPMAEIVCDEHFDSAPDLRALALALAGEIPGKDQAAKFKAEVAKALSLDSL